jgi:hypothetical protein
MRRTYDATFSHLNFVLHENQIASSGLSVNFCHKNAAQTRDDEEIKTEEPCYLFGASILYSLRRCFADENLQSVVDSHLMLLAVCQHILSHMEKYLSVASKLLINYYNSLLFVRNRLCSLVVRVPGYISRDPGSIPSRTRFSEK